MATKKDPIASRRHLWRACPRDKAVYVRVMRELTDELKAQGKGEILGMNHDREERDGVDGVLFEVVAYKKNVIRRSGTR